MYHNLKEQTKFCPNYPHYELFVDDEWTDVQYHGKEFTVRTSRFTKFLRDNPLFHDHLRSTQNPFDNAFQYDALFGIPEDVGKLFAIQLNCNQA